MAQDAGVTASTELDAVKQAAIIAIVQRELKFMAKLLPTITDVSAFAAKGMKSCSFPKTGSMTVSNRATGEKGTPQTLTFSNDTLEFNQRAYVAWLVDAVDEYQSTPEIQGAFVKRAGTAHARNIDSLIMTQLDTYAGYVQTAGITKAKILNARKWLLKNQAFIDDITILVNPDDEALLLAIDEFVSADKYGSSNIPNGVIGRIFGMNVMVHTDPANAKSWIYSKEAVAFGLQKAPAYGQESKIEYGVGSLLCAVDQLFGLKAMRLTEGLDSAGVALGANKSPFIAELSGV